MKALSIKQPWAWAILHAGKDVENRSWKTHYRGPLLIHAPLSFDWDGYRFLQQERQVDGLPQPHEFQRGGVVGVCGLVAVRDPDGSVKGWTSQQPYPAESSWFFGPYGWLLRDPKPIEFSPCKGHQGLFEVEIVVDP